MAATRHVKAVQRALRPFLAAVTQPPVQGRRPMIADFVAGKSAGADAAQFRRGAETMERSRLDRVVRLPGAVALALYAVVEPGDEVVFLSPPRIFYEAMILASGATPVRFGAPTPGLQAGH